MRVITQAVENDDSFRNGLLDCGLISLRDCTDEENELAAAEWYKVYGIIYDKPDQAQKLYQQIENAASKEDKDAALKRIEERKAAVETEEDNNEN